MNLARTVSLVPATAADAVDRIAAMVAHAQFGAPLTGGSACEKEVSRLASSLRM